MHDYSPISGEILQERIFSSLGPIVKVRWGGVGEVLEIKIYNIMAKMSKHSKYKHIEMNESACAVTLKKIMIIIKLWGIHRHQG